MCDLCLAEILPAYQRVRRNARALILFSNSYWFCSHPSPAPYLGGSNEATLSAINVSICLFWSQRIHQGAWQRRLWIVLRLSHHNNGIFTQFHLFYIYIYFLTHGSHPSFYPYSATLLRHLIVFSVCRFKFSKKIRSIFHVCFVPLLLGLWCMQPCKSSDHMGIHSSRRLKHYSEIKSCSAMACVVMFIFATYAMKFYTPTNGFR